MNIDDPGRSLRTIDLNPSQENLAFRDDRPAVVAAVVAKRAELLGTVPEQPPTTNLELHGGRLAVYFPDEQLADGAAEAETNGFYDVEDSPPWDTWIGLYIDSQRNEYLVNWVPEPLIDRVSRGLWANPVECIAWLHTPLSGRRPEPRAYDPRAGRASLRLKPRLTSATPGRAPSR